MEVLHCSAIELRTVKHRQNTECENTLYTFITLRLMLIGTHLANTCLQM